LWQVAVTKKIKMRCPISFIEVNELEHPVVFDGERVPTVFDADSLIKWLGTSRRNPVTNAVLPPLPLESLVVPYRLPHTTDAQMEETRQMLTGRHSRLEAWEGAIKAIINKYGERLVEVAMTPCCAALGILIGVTIFFVHMDLMHYIVLKGTVAYMQTQHSGDSRMDEVLLELLAMHRRQREVFRFIALIYSKVVHPPLQAILAAYFGSDDVIGQWCAIMAHIAAAHARYNVTDQVGVGVLLDTCE